MTHVGKNGSRKSKSRSNAVSAKCANGIKRAEWDQLERELQDPGSATHRYMYAMMNAIENHLKNVGFDQTFSDQFPKRASTDS